MERRTFLKALGVSTAMGAIAANEPAPTPAINNRQPVKLNRESTGLRNQNRSTVTCRNGIVCTSQPLATLAGVDILRDGGNAIDAAICANAMLSLVEPMNCGPGGDLFAIVWIEKERKLYGLNASGRAPFNWNLDEAEGKGIKSIPGNSPLAWNVPGCVSGWDELQSRFGALKIGRTLEPAIRYAREGFPVSSIIASDWPFAPDKFPTLAKTFMPEGKAPAYGDVFRNLDLAATYEMLSRDGARAFYEGAIAERIVKFSTETGGYFSLRDFKEHQPTWVEPACTNYRGYDVWEIPPNGQGISVLQILNMLELFDIPSMTPNSPEQLHLFIEAKKLAYEDRAVYYADMQFTDVPLEWLISKEYARQRAKKIDPKKAAEDVIAGDPTHSDTIYLTAADKDGNMVSLIQSTYHGWGSHFVPGDLGFALQNRGMSFSLDPKHRNRLEPGKRPFHTIIPAFVTKDGNPALSFGVMGGDFQPQGHSQVLMNMIDFGMSPQQAGEQPRVEHAGSSTPSGHRMTRGGGVNCEPGITEATRRALAEMGHHVTDNPDTFGGYQAIWREEEPRRYFGGSDPRKDGCAIGF